MVLRGRAHDLASELVADIAGIAAAAPFHHQITPGGKPMSAAMTNCGALGWITDARGYRYAGTDPQTGRSWPPMPTLFEGLARDAAAEAGFPDFRPDACLVNRYVPGARMSLHQDRDEADFTQPIVSVSIGLPAIFLWGGQARADRPRRVPLLHGDVVVWGGPDRLVFHGVHPLGEGTHPLTGAVRYNLTFRRAG
ncbi:DNA oxidative demethylase AlkB [Phenylobacterium aquaticum]|uniref:DNA oxidative demethylase AlkB n=1 Tax=Phenylobacterium aquaticum TaxID=1763816 RepID=UPI001F5D5599|nr:DNA oxidative demethylase AlkB [Phenylobacterium aquaticum]MCI3133013.1 DNA oxidative demethylase AlkB [Phenylobacterium aquaticum]